MPTRTWDWNARAAKRNQLYFIMWCIQFNPTSERLMIPSVANGTQPMHGGHAFVYTNGSRTELCWKWKSPRAHYHNALRAESVNIKASTDP